ncbi:MAG: sulfotransferase family protein [Rubrobacter sp.]
MNPYLFMVGCPRSGTTLLRRLMDAHPLVAVVDETRWIAGFYERRAGLTPEGMVTPKLVSRLLDYDRFAKIGVGREDLENLLASGEPISYASFVSGIFDLYGQARGKRLVGDKTPRYARKVPTLHGLWPEAKFVHLIRDGRDVCLSILNWKKSQRSIGRFESWRADPVTTTALWWELHLSLAREDGAPLGPGLYHEVRYESVVARPGEECERLCGFLGIPYDDAMLRFHEGRERSSPGLDAKKAWRPVTGGLRHWRSQMPAADVERFEAAAGGLLEDLGYERFFPNPSSEAIGRASETRRRFVRELRERKRRIPERWRV